jgi:2-polyprenyl-3-methyl-5-hydroxy-6-metoxy-1,4-benzoquinol methylase
MDTTGERQEGIKLEEIESKHVERYRYATKFCVGKKVLDAGCGVGYGSSIISSVANCVVSIDNSQYAIDYANKHWSRDNVKFLVTDLTGEIHHLGLFDVIVTFENVEHLPIPIFDTCCKYYNALLPNGLLIISHPEKEPVCKNKFHYHFNIDGKKFSSDLVKIGFKVEEDWLQPKRFVADYHIVVARKYA